MKQAVVVSAIALGLFALSLMLSHSASLLVATAGSIAFPAATAFVHDREIFTKEQHREAVRKTRILAVLLVLGLALAELLGKQDKHVLQAVICVVISNATLFWVDDAGVDKGTSITAKNNTIVKVEKEVHVPDLSVNNEATNSGEAVGRSELVGNNITDDRSTKREVTVIAARDVAPVSQSATVAPTIVQREFAVCGNGQGEELSEEQIKLCRTLYKMVIDSNLSKFREANCETEMLDYCDVEACRRFLVARGWSLNKAFAQLDQTIQWRMKHRPWTFEFKNSPVCLNNPHAVNMRMVGTDSSHRPVIFTSFIHAHDRFDAEAGIHHFELLLESVRQIISKQFRTGVTKNADELQWVLVVDFAGFSIRDANPKASYYAGKLMTHFPEMLNQAVLIESPALFSSAWNLLQTVIDDRVKAKIAFVTLKNVQQKLENKLGKEMVDWLLRESESCRAHKHSAKEKRAYWRVQADGHDPRGVSSYVNSEIYVETPGDAWAKKQQTHT